MNPVFILIAIPFFLLSVAAEWLYSYLKNHRFHRFEDTLTNLNLGIGHEAVGLFVKIILLGCYDWAYRDLRLFTPEVGWLLFAGTFLLYDFLFYWAHRWGHEIGFFWAAHIVHHQSSEYNLSVALRQSWFHNLFAFIIFMPLPLLGIPTQVFGAVAIFSSLWQFWIHTRTINKLGILEGILNTPSAHRVHHATNPEYLDKNYAAVLILWDRLFGTYQPEKAVPVYGITKPFRSLNPVWANFHVFSEMYTAARAERGLVNKLRIPFRSPSYIGRLLEDIPMEMPPKPVSKPLRRYVSFQFLLLVWGIISYLTHFHELEVFYRIIFLCIIILTLLSCSAILESKTWVKVPELLRLMSIVVALNSIYSIRYPDWHLLLAVMSGGTFMLSVLWFICRWEGLSPQKSMI
jgi:sterol desaturase/sphingolipid hydroxylase (fatty acid hydroxylase superfamily)